MFTVKLVRSQEMKIVEAVGVSVYNVGKPHPTLDSPKAIATVDYINDSIREIRVQLAEGHTESFYVSQLGILPGSEIPTWDMAYIENSHGATTERVIPGASI